MKYIIFIFMFVLSIHSFSQKMDSDIQFLPTFNYQPLQMNKNYLFHNDSLQLSTFKFYISDISFFQNEKLVGIDSRKCHLIDAEVVESMRIRTIPKKFNRISFNIGIDSLTNVLGVLTDDLDPMKGMYWTWQSGYINLKLEGVTNICPSRNHAFVFHIGGYRHPFNSIQKLVFAVQSGKRNLIVIDVSKLLNRIGLNEMYEVMTPNKKSVFIAQQFADAISIVP